LSAFYKGFSLKLVKAVPAPAIDFFVYESIAEQMREYNTTVSYPGQPLGSHLVKNLE
jgi:hypothetical protein